MDKQFKSLMLEYEICDQTVRDKNKQKLVLWFNQQRSAVIPVSGAICAAKAKYFFEELKIPVDFNASIRWLTRLKQRYCIRQITVQSENLSSDTSAAEDFVLEFRIFVRGENLSAEQLYNPDETG
ncbi:Jerky -like [Araneus ventricosus]|uniref:Jerky-like n=1 Tax=Araneus ventricosus TaxID=182803 RepID=A0A4Y2W2C1_ARAVE|nr:Jerky -like [Araneus ventricosus]